MTLQDEQLAATLAALRNEVRAARAARPAGEQSGAARELQHAIEELEYTRVVSAHWPLEATSLIGRAWVLVHKLVRRYLRWYINPIVEQQNAYNDTVARALRLLAAEVGALRAEAAAQRDTAQTPTP